MKRIRTLLTLILALCMLLPSATAEEGAPGYDFGDVVADFTITTIDGETLTLSGMLAEKKAVMLNFWFASCSPCRMEFPAIEKAWQEYQDDVALLAISPYDSVEAIAAYREEMGLSFPMATDNAGLTELFVSSGFPTTIMIDRNGVYCYYECGSMPSAYRFRTLFGAFTSDDYAESLLGYVIPDPTPDQPTPDASLIAAALGSDGVNYSGEEGQWAWLLSEEGLVTSNQDAADSEAVLHLDFTANAGDVLRLELRVSAYVGADSLSLEHNGQVQKRFSVDKGWESYAWAVPQSGAQRVTLRFHKASAMPAGENAAMLRSVELLTGQAAADALAANPVYPTPLEGATVSLEPGNAAAQEILVDDPYGLMMQLLGVPARYFIVPEETAELRVRIGPDVDPDAAFLYDSMTQQITMLSQAAVVEDSFVIPGKVYSMFTGGNPFSAFVLYPDFTAYDGSICAAIVFADEANANYLLKTYVNQATGGAITGLEWRYAAPAEVSYRLVFVDETGAPLPGVIANICDEESCMPMAADENGVVAFTMAGKAYDIHVISAPEGIAFDPDQGYKTSETGGDMTITLPRK